MTTITLFFTLLLNANLDVFNNSVFLLSLGIYYGLLTTFPVGPSHLLCVRTCLLEVEEAKIESPNTVITNKLIVAAISGLVLSQLLVFLSLYWTPLQVFWTKPQMWTFLILPYFVFSLSPLKIFSIFRLFKSDNSIYNSQVRITFINGLLFQLLNPILLSNPILTRLMSVFFFRYSSKLWFVTGGILGWLGGQTLFVYLNWYLLFRLQYDTSTIYSLLKRGIHAVWYPILLTMFLFSSSYISLSEDAISTIFLSSSSNLNRSEDDISRAKETNNISGAKEINNISGAKETSSLSKVFSLWPECFFGEDVYTRPIYAVLESTHIHLIDIDETEAEAKAETETEAEAEAEAEQELKLEINESLSNQTKNESNLVVDIVNLNEDTFDTLPIAEETDQISEDKQTDQISEDKQTDQISKDRETDQISKDRETDQISEDRETDQIYNNRRFSEHLFDKCVTNGKHKLSYIFPQNRIIFSTYFSNVFETLDFSKPLKSNVYQNWVYSKSIRKTNLKNILKNRIKTLDKENSMDIALDQKTRSKDYAENFIENTLDLRLNSNKRGYQLCLFGNEDDQMVVDKDVDTLDSVDTLDGVDHVFDPLIETPLVDTLDSVDTLDGVDHVFDPLIETPLVDTNTRLAINTELPLHFEGYHVLEEGINVSNEEMRRHPKHRHALILSMPDELDIEEIHSDSILLNRNLYYTSSVPIKTAKNLLLDAEKHYEAPPEPPVLYYRLKQLRNCMLFSQIYIRRHAIIPMLIILKDRVRWFLRQPSEFKQDMVELTREEFSSCNFKPRGKDDFIIGELPKEWLKKGFQIKITSPFCLTPWRSSRLGRRKDFFLGVWGEARNHPFGHFQKRTAFWKPIWRVLTVKVSHWGAKQFAKMIKLVLPLVHSLVHSLVPFSKQNLLVLTKVFNANLINEIQNRFGQKNSETPLLWQQSSQLQKKKTLQTDQIASTNKHSFSVSNLIDSVDSNELLNLKRNLIKKRKHIQHKLIQIEHISELFKTQNSIGSNKLVQISLSKSLFVARNVNKNTRFQIQTISEPSFKSFKCKHLIFKSKLLHLKQEYTQINVQINQLNTQWVNLLSKAYLLFNIDLSYKYTQSFILISRYFTDMVISWFNDSNIWIHNMVILNHRESIMKQNVCTSTSVPSQAYVLHKIWETNTRIKMSINSLTNNLVSNHSFKPNEHKLLLTKGILTTQTPEMLTKNTWNKLIEDFPQYIPSSKLWIDIVPKKWINQIQTHWNTRPRFEYQRSENELLPQHLESHQQSVKRAQKLFAQWKGSLVAKTYTSSIQDRIPYKSVLSETFTNQTLQNRVLNKSSLFEILTNQDILVNTEETAASIPPDQDILVNTEETAASIPPETHPLPLPKPLSKPLPKPLSNPLPLLIDDRILTYNLVSPFLRFADEDYNSFVQNISHLLLSKSLTEYNVFPIVSLIIENTWLFNKSREFRLLEFLNLEIEMHNLENIKPLSKKENHLLEQKETNTKNIVADPLDTNDSKFGMSNQTLGSTNEIQRFLWPIHRLEDLACINRFWVGSGNQSRLNALRIRMYPFILS